MSWLMSIIEMIGLFFVAHPAIALMISAPLFIVANMIGGVILAEKEGEFDLEILKASLYKYMAIVLMSALLSLGGVLAESVINKLFSVDLKITFVMMIALGTLAMKYATDATVKLYTIVGYKVPTAEEK